MNHGEQTDGAVVLFEGVSLGYSRAPVLSDRDQRRAALRGCSE